MLVFATEKFIPEYPDGTDTEIFNRWNKSDDESGKLSII